MTIMMLNKIEAVFAGNTDGGSILDEHSEHLTTESHSEAIPALSHYKLPRHVLPWS